MFEDFTAADYQGAKLAPGQAALHVRGGCQRGAAIDRQAGHSSAALGEGLGQQGPPALAGHQQDLLAG